jgi:type II secretory pathway component GspD/PulD (secretin)
MKTKTTLLLVLGAALMSATALAQQNNTVLLAGAANETPADKVEYKAAALDLIIQDLAKQADLNVYIDQKITESLYGVDGKTLLPKGQATFTWYKVTPRQALVAVLDNHGFVAIPDLNTKVVRITLKDPAAKEPPVLKTIPIRYASATNILALLKPALGAASQAQADARGNTLFVITTETEFANISNMVAKLDSVAPQILIEAKFAETAKNPKSVKGIDWSGTLEAQNLYFGNGITAGNTTTTIPGATTTTPGAPLPSGAAGTGTGTTPPYTASTLLNSAVGYGSGGLSVDTLRGFYPHTAFLNADGAKAVLSFLNTENDTEFIAQPRAVTLNGVQTELSSIQNVPVFEEQQGAITGSLQQPNTVKPNYNLTVGQTILNEVGVKLVVTPRVVGQSDIMLDLRPEISSVDGVERKLLGGRVNESPVFRRQRLNTTATVPSGNTLVLGGLLQDTVTKAYTKVPVLGDMPGLGLLFRRDSKSRAKRNLLIFVTPTVVTDGDYQPATSNFLKSKYPDKPDLDETGWETGAPASKYRPLF